MIPVLFRKDLSKKLWDFIKKASVEQIVGVIYINNHLENVWWVLEIMKNVVVMVNSVSLMSFEILVILWWTLLSRENLPDIMSWCWFSWLRWSMSHHWVLTLWQWKWYKWPGLLSWLNLIFKTWITCPFQCHSILWYLCIFIICN